MAVLSNSFTFLFFVLVVVVALILIFAPRWKLLEEKTRWSLTLVKSWI